MATLVAGLQCFCLSCNLRVRTETPLIDASKRSRLARSSHEHTNPYGNQKKKCEKPDERSRTLSDRH